MMARSEEEGRSDAEEKYGRDRRKETEKQVLGGVSASNHKPTSSEGTTVVLFGTSLTGGSFNTTYRTPLSCSSSV